MATCKNCGHDELEHVHLEGFLSADGYAPSSFPCVKIMDHFTRETCKCSQFEKDSSTVSAWCATRLREAYRCGLLVVKEKP